MRQKEIQNQQIEGPNNEKSSQIFINIDNYVLLDVLIKPQIFTNKSKVFIFYFFINFIKEKPVQEKYFHWM